MLCYQVFLFDSLIGYLLYGYKTVVPQAFQRLDQLTVIDMVSLIVKNASQIILVLLFRNYYLYLLVIPAVTILRNFGIAYMVDKRYPLYQPSGKLTKEQIHDLLTRVKGIAIGKVCITSRNGIDSMCLSALFISAFHVAADGR